MNILTRFAALSLLLGVSTVGVSMAAADPAPTKYPAPTRLHADPNLYMMLRLNGDRAHFRYSPGSLDRAANLQFRLERAARLFEKWTDKPQQLSIYVMFREDWKQSRFPIPYGIPVRFATHGIAVAAAGDEGTVALWAELLGGALPVVPGIPLVGTPKEAATMILADGLVQLQAAQVLVDDLDLSGDGRWVRGVVAHLIDQSLIRQLEPHREAEIHSIYALLGQRHAPRAYAARDDRPELGLEDWLWFQAQYHAGAKILLDKIGKGAVKEMRKLRRKGDGVLRGEEILRRYKPFAAWYREAFAAVSTVPTPVSR